MPVGVRHAGRARRVPVGTTTRTLVCGAQSPRMGTPDPSRHTGLMSMETDNLDRALHDLAATAPEVGAHGCSNHGPMVAEALEQMGRAHDIDGWVAAYTAHLDPAPPAAE